MSSHGGEFVIIGLPGGKSFSKKHFLTQSLGDFRNVITLTARKPVESVSELIVEDGIVFKTALGNLVPTSHSVLR